MMLALLIYCYANGIFSSRRVERATHRDIAVRFLTGDTHPDHDTIARFRRENFEVMADCFVQVLELAKELKLLKVGMVSVDGTKVKANASKNRNVRYDRAGQLIETLREDVRELLEKAEGADLSDEQDGQRLPADIARAEALKEKLEEARRNIEERARVRAEGERAEYERKMAERAKRKGPRGCEVKEPDPTPRPEEQVNLTDPDSRLMCKNKRSGFEQSYNAQAAVDADGSQLILGARVSQCAADKCELEPTVRAIPESLGRPATVLADNGYLCEAQVRALEGSGEEPAMEVLVSAHAEAKELGRKYDFRPPPPEKETKNQIRSPFVLDMKERMGREEARRKYRKRKQTVEPVFGIIKKCMGFTQFHLRGFEKVSGEWTLVALAYNFKRLWNLINAPKKKNPPRNCGNKAKAAVSAPQGTRSGRGTMPTITPHRPTWSGRGIETYA
jgi:hypothetical protein